ncbi:MAG: hypothetical protein IJ736_00995 [Firmicutes bacterium]|nr:hypothetical protein [Bacillota bacterium]
MKTTISFKDLYELSRFVKSFVFEGGKDFTFSKFNDLQISMNFNQITMESELTGSELETLLSGKKIKYNYVQQF